MDSSKSYSVLLIDDHPLLRKGIVQLLEYEQGLHTVGEASSGAEGVEQAKLLRPDLILLDMNMKGMTGIDTLKAIRAAQVKCQIVIFTVSDDDSDVIEALRAGADGYLLKDMEPESLVEQLYLAAQGQLVINERLASVMAAALRSGGDSKSGQQQMLSSLTEREKQILKLITRGFSNKLIARKLDITEGTVKVHVKHLLKKLDLNSRVEAAVWGVKQGLQ